MSKINIKAVETALKKNGREKTEKWAKLYEREHNGRRALCFTNTHWAARIYTDEPMVELIGVDDSIDFTRAMEPKGEFEKVTIDKNAVAEWKKYHDAGEYTTYPVKDSAGVYHWYNPDYLLLAFRVFSTKTLGIDIPTGRKLFPAKIETENGDFVITPARVANEEAALDRPGFDIPNKAELIASLPEPERKFAEKLIDAIETGKCKTGYQLEDFATKLAYKTTPGDYHNETVKAVLAAADAVTGTDGKKWKAEKKAEDIGRAESAYFVDGEARAANEREIARMKAETESAVESPAALESGRVYYVAKNHNEKEFASFCGFGPDYGTWLDTREKAEKHVRSYHGFVRFCTTEEYEKMAYPFHLARMKNAIETGNLRYIRMMLRTAESPDFYKPLFERAFHELTAGMTPVEKFGDDWRELDAAETAEEEAYQRIKDGHAEGMATGTIYYTMRAENGLEWEHESIYGPECNNKTRIGAEYRAKMTSGFIRFCTAREFHAMRYGRAYRQMKDFFDAEKIEKIRDWLMNNSNTYSIRAFAELSGVKLDRSWRRREKQLAEYYGEKWEKMLADKASREAAEKVAKKEQEAAAKQAEIDKAMQSIKDGHRISGREFVDLCDYHGVKMHLRTRGFCLNTMYDVDVMEGVHGVYVSKTNRNPRSDGFWIACRELREILQKKFDAEARPQNRPRETASEAVETPSEGKPMPGEEKSQEGPFPGACVDDGPDWAELYASGNLDALEAALTEAGTPDKYAVAIIVAAEYRLIGAYWDKLAEAGLTKEKAAA